MEDFLYAYNQPKKFGKYDLFLDGKIAANEVVYKVLTEDNDIENINIADKVKELESKLLTHFTFETVTELPTEGKETVIYLVANDEGSGDKDSYNEYMWVKEKGGFELIGSGSYAKQQADLDKEIADRIADVNAEETRAKEAEKVLTDKLTKEVEDRTNADTTLDEKITDEKERAEGVEKVLTDNLAQEIADRIANVNEEESRATEKEGELSTAIEQEVTNRTNADDVLDKKIDETNSVLTTQISDITKEGGTIDSKISVAEEELTNKISTLESTIDELKKSIVLLELPNYSINKSSTFTDTEGDNQSYTVLLDMPKGSLIKGNNTTEVKINDEIIGDFIFNIDDLGIITSNQQQFSYKLSDEIITTSTTDEGVLQDDGSTLITTTTTTTTTPRQLLITIGISGTHKESTLDIDFSVEKLIDQTHTETTTSTETIPPSTEITE